MTQAAPPEPASESPEEVSTERYMTVLEHIEELRFRLFISAVVIVIGLGVSFFFGGEIIEFLKRPAEARGRGELELQFIEPFELFVTFFRVSLLGGLIMGMPMMVYQGLRFVSPGLSGNERRWLYATVLGTFALFLGGVAFAYYVALPPALDFLLDFGGGDIAKADIRVSSYVDFVTRLLFWTGVAFQTPLIVMYLSRFGIVTPGQLLRWWRFAIVAAFVVAAIVTPTIDPVTQSLVAGPIIVLYFLGIILGVIVRRKPKNE
ncbi:MAG: twin-arginine translocase subunit TatC [Dehalococcoidia bacterium]